MGRFDNMKRDWGKPPEKPAPSDSSDFELLPDGVYTCELYDIQERSPKRGGEAFSVTLKIASGDYQNRRVWDWINFDLPHSPKATEIGQETFRALCRACGFTDAPPSELGELIGQELDVKIGRRAASGDYPAKNVVKQYLAFQLERQPAGDDTDDLF